MKKKKNKRNEFRKRHSKKGKGHPAYIFERVGKDYKFIGITHEPTARVGNKKTINIKLEKNPEPKRKETSYIKPLPEQEETITFAKKPLVGWKFSHKDKQIVEKIKKIEPVKTTKSKHKKTTKKRAKATSRKTRRS